MDESDHFNPLSTTSARLEVVRLQSANKLIFRALVSIASATLLIRVMGLGMQVVVTSRFGEGTSMDAYLVATSAPLLLASIADTLLESAIIPVYARVRARNAAQISTLFSTLLNLTMLCALVLTGVLVLLRGQVIFLSAPALGLASSGLATSLAPIIFPVFLMMTVASFLQTILNAEGQFGWPAYAGVLVPFSIAVLALLAGSALGVGALCLGMLIGVCFEVIVFVARIQHAHVAYRFTLDLRSPDIAAVLAAAGPVLLGALIGEINPFIDQMFASSLAPGSISALSYALKLVSVPVGVVFASAGRAALPYLSRQAAVRDMTGFKRTFRLYTWMVGTITLVLSVGMFVLANPIVRLLFQRGAFTSSDTAQTAYVFQGFAVGLAPMALVFIGVRAFNALGKNHLLIYASVIGVIANAALDYILARFWQGFGIALATSVVYFCTMCFMLLALRLEIGELNLIAPPLEIFSTLTTRGLRDAVDVQPISIRHLNDSSTPMREARIPREGSGVMSAGRRAAESFRGALLYVAAALGAAVLGIATTFVGPVTALELLVAVPAVLASLRYRYALLLAWAATGVLNGAALPIVQDYHPDVPLIPSTLLLMFGGPLRKTLQRLPALAVMLLFLLWVFAGINISPLGVSEFLKNWFIYLSYIGLAVLAINVLTTRGRIIAVIDLMLLVAALVSLYGIAGYFTHHNILVDASTGRERITSIFVNAPPLALLLTTVIPLSLFRILTVGGWRRLIYLVLMLLLFAATGLTFTRGAIVALPVDFILFVVLLRSRAVRTGLVASIALVTVITVLLVTVGGVPLLDRFSAGDVATLNGRTYLWEAILNYFDPGQIFGRGLFASDYLLTSLQIGQNGEIGNGLIATSPSNLFIGTLFDSGIVGLLLLVGAFLTMGFSLFTGVRRAVGERQLLFVAAFVVLINMLIQSVEENDFWTQAIAIYFWLIVALPFAVHWDGPDEPDAAAQPQNLERPETYRVLEETTTGSHRESS